MSTNIQSIQSQSYAKQYKAFFVNDQSEGDDPKEKVLTVSQANLDKLKYKRWAPVWEFKDHLAFPLWKPFVHTDRGYFGDPSFDSLFKGTGATSKVITPKLGLEVRGLQLSKLTDKQKDDLALLVEQRGVVAFRDQDFKHLPFEDLRKFGEYFGPLHVHPITGSPKGHPEFHLTFRKGDPGEQKRLLAQRLNYIGWHSDVTYETQPPAVTFLTMIQTGAGGDTQFVDMIEAYERLSPTMKRFVDHLHVANTSRQQEWVSKSNGGLVRKPAIDSIHPLVRYHPVLRKKALFLNTGFSTRILGLKLEESDALLKFLIHHTETLLDAHIRASWDENTVVAWDNRRLIHTSTLDWDSDDIRTSFRITPLGERPVGSEEEYQAWTPELEEQKIKDTQKNLDLTPEEYYNKFYAGKL